MHTFILAFTAILGFSQAQKTVTLTMPGYDTQPLAASVISADATATTYLINCAPGTNSDDCGIGSSITFTEGPSTAAVTYSAEYDNDNDAKSSTLAFTGYQQCSLDGSISAVCIESFGGAEANFPGISTTTYTGTDLGIMPVTITAGAAVVATSASSTGSSATMSASITARKSEVASTTSASESSSTESHSTSASATSAAKAGGGAVVRADNFMVIGGMAMAMMVLG